MLNRRLYPGCSLILLLLLVAGIAVPTSARADFQVATDASRKMAVANTKRIKLTIVKLPLAGVMQSIAEQAKIKVTIEKGVSATLSDVKLDCSFKDCMDIIAHQADVLWWWRGDELYLGSRKNSVSKTIKTRFPAEILKATKTLGLPTEALSMKTVPGSGMMQVTGPAALVNEYEVLAGEVEKQLRSIQVTRYGRRRFETR